ncbi:MAG: aldehyde dehydrogenase [Rhodocyclales bacterium]|nr:aldehyde dehydrogenase [Rhodocyclales bacterium]
MTREQGPQTGMAARLRHRNYIDGKWVDSISGRRFAVYDPADLRERCHEYPLSTREDAEAAVRGAHEAFGRWRKAPLGERAAILRRAAQLIRARRDVIAPIVTRENGKLIAESLTEIDAAALELEYQIGEGERAFGRIGDCYRGGLLGYSRREPLGVVSVIVPWNFPFNVPWRKLGPALIAGNTAILKPASQTPAVGEAVMQILIEAGLPAGVVQFVTGSGGELSQALVGHPLVRAVTFTGSTEVGRQIARLAGERFTRTQLEMGGKNPMVVLKDADLDLSSQDAAVGAFSCAGQWCTATSRLIVEDAIADELLAKLKAKTAALRLGRGTDAAATMGPVAGRAQLDSILGHIARANAQGARFVAGGGRATAHGLEHGCFIEPSIVDNPPVALDISTTEVFGPVLAVYRVPGYEAALALANAVPYGLSSSIYTRDLDRALHFAEHSEVGLTHINVHSAYKEPQHSFGGVKESGFGLPEAGSTGIQFFQDEKAVYVRKRDFGAA